MFRSEPESFEDPPGSVRVEVERASGGSDESIAMPRGTRPSRSVMLLAIASIAGLIGVILMLRPAADETAQGAPSVQTSVPAPTASLEQRLDETGGVAAESDAPEFATTSETRDVAGIVRADVGYLAVGWPADDGLDGPPILRSLDGLSWNSVESMIVGLPERDVAAPSHRQFTNLINVDSGFALMAITTTFNGGPDPTHNLIRLISDSGSEWEPDPDFERVETSTHYPWVGSHTVDSFVFVDSERRPGDDFAKVIREETRDRLEVGAACGADARSSTISIYYCGPEPPLSLTPESVVDPDTFDALGKCLVQLTNQRFSPSELRVVGRSGAGSRALTELGTPIASPASFEGGTIASIDVGSNIRRGEDPCEEFRPIPDPVPPAVLLWPPGEQLPIRIDIPSSALSSAELLSVRVEPTAVGRLLLILARDALWQFDIDSYAWTKLLDTPSPIVPSTAIALSSNASTVLVVGQGFLGVGDTATASWEWLDVDVPADLPSIVYADDQTAFIQGNGDLFKIALPPR